MEEISFGSRLRALRSTTGLSMRKLGEILGVTESAMHTYETDKHFPPPDVLCALADYYGLSLDMLIRGKEKEPSPEVREQLNNVGMDAIASLPPQEQRIALAVLAALQPPAKE